MKPVDGIVAFAIIVIAASSFVLGVYHERSGKSGERNLQAQIEANEMACIEGTPDGRVAYPVTHFGELRGCITASKDAAYMDLEHPIFLRKVKP